VVTLALLASSVFTGCTSTVHYAVLVARPVAEAGSGCFGQCQLLRAAGTKQYLECLRTCPDARVVTEKECDEVTFDHEHLDCTTEQNHRFNAGLTILAIVLASIGVVLLGAAMSSGQQQQVQ
jgi:hypothetical protein